MAIFEIKTAWSGKDQTFHPGRYRVPEQLSKSEARCARADGAGKYVSGPEAAREDATFPGGKRPAPENKSRGAAPDNKSEVGKLSPGDRGGTGAKPGARTLTTGSAGGRSGAGDK